MRLDFKAEGFEDLAKVLRELPNAMRNRVALSSLRAGGAVLSKEMKRLAPVGTPELDPKTMAPKLDPATGAPKKHGELKKAIGTKVITSRKAGVRAISVGVRGKKSPLAHIIELGNTKHPAGYPIVPVKGKALRWVDKSGNVVVARKVFRPPLTPRPFIRPALDTKAGEVVAAMRQRLYERLNVEIIRLANPGKKVRIVRTK